jgi:hypothetical protein
LHIHFALGERPHAFWVSDWTAGAGRVARYKVLSKQRADRSLEVLVIEERAGGNRRALLRRDLDASAPAGWLGHWIEELAQMLSTKLHAFDLRHIQSEAEWCAAAERLGWLEPSRARPRRP